MFLKRMFYILLLPLFIGASMFANERILIDYKNMALEADSSPKWLEELFKNEKSDKLIAMIKFSMQKQSLRISRWLKKRLKCMQCLIAKEN